MASRSWDEKSVRRLTRCRHDHFLQPKFRLRHAIALDSVTGRGEPFPRVATNNFSTDQRTRLMLFTRYLDFAPGETQSAVTARAEDSQLITYELPVEFVGKVPGYEWLTQVNVKLPSNITPGDVTVRIYLRGIVSNSARIRVN